jgi:hypothetical protein
MTTQTNHLKLPILPSFVFSGSKKQNEPKVGEASLLRYHLPRPEGTSKLLPFLSAIASATADAFYLFTLFTKRTQNIAFSTQKQGFPKKRTQICGTDALGCGHSSRPEGTSIFWLLASGFWLQTSGSFKKQNEPKYVIFNRKSNLENLSPRDRKSQNEPKSNILVFLDSCVLVVCAKQSQS